MLNTYFEQELGRLRSLASEFAELNPALAPMLGADVAPDPDVERLLEGVAFLTGLMRQRLDDDFPEFVQTLVQLLMPHFLRPWPCMTIMQFQPQGPLGGTVTLAANIAVASVPVDGMRTIFRTSFPVTVEPLALRSASWDGGAGTQRSLLLEFAFEGVTPQAWQGRKLGLYLADAMPDAARLLLLLARYVREVHVFAAGEAVTVLPADSISITGLHADALLLPQSENAHPAYELLREYFAFPEKFLHISIDGFERWLARGSSGRFSLRVVFDELPDWAPAVHDESFLLNTTPAVNLFDAQAHPLHLDDRQPAWQLQFPQKDGRHLTQVFSIEQVSGYADGETQRYVAFGTANADEPVYHTTLRESPLREGVDCHISVVQPRDGAGNARGEPRESATRTLSVDALCTHGALPEVLRLGDICHPTDSSPARMNFRNIRRISPYRVPVLDQRLLWRLVSQLNLNHRQLAGRDQLCALLALQFTGGRSTPADAAHQRRVDAIESFAVKPADRLMNGLLVSGCEIELVCRSDAFMNIGGLFLFGAVLDDFFAGTVALNAFSALSITDSLTGGKLQWPAKIGQQHLL
ncbi:type VI secretion system baseplate subunit TssF [Paraburkholderia agricolaris]|uniref:type VI secretion system baseplate subunit TssF n=1 Tax=Paraburkholderia agricolaris TaxID=2152888 RepID=UPI001291B651|nr:type VI secretion system baseplate subunit TssF [Paraburkholderia agricolaris]